MNRLEQEIAYRLAAGHRLLTVKQFAAEFAALGYRLNRKMDCRGIARYISGDRKDTSYPVCTPGLTELATGLSAFHFQGGRGKNFQRMQKLRNEIFAVTAKGDILEV